MASNPPIDTLDPEALRTFLDGLRASGFEPLTTDERTWSGLTPPSLRAFTPAPTMEITVQDGWPYLPPQLKVEGIQSWHADRDRLCLWQQGDNTKAWTTMDGILARIEQWAQNAQAGFADSEGAALDPHLYFEAIATEGIGIDLDQLIRGAFQDGQHGPLHLSVWRHIPVLHSGRPTNRPDPTMHGRWFYRSQIAAPPARLDQFEAALTNTQRQRYESDLKQFNHAFFALVWPTPHGHSPLILAVNQADGTRTAVAHEPVPISATDRLRRAGPDAQVLQTNRVVLLGVGAIGSHVASLLARSGVRDLMLVDADVLYPAGQVRHAAEADALSVPKPALMQRRLRDYDWTNIETVAMNPWKPTELADRLRGHDLCIDATGLGPFTELLSRVSATEDVPLVVVALYRGGAIARVRRQAHGDTPILARADHWRYPEIAPVEPSEDYIGVEVGCTAPIHNAPPASVTHAASLATVAAIDILTGRRQMQDEIIDVIRPSDPPFDRPGRYTPVPTMLSLTDQARSAMIEAALRARPNETGGVLVGTHDADGAPVISQAIEIPAPAPSPSGYLLPTGATTDVIDGARAADPRLGYLGEWHSHPTDQPASPKDRATMRTLANHPNTGTPALLVIRPTPHDHYQIDGYIAAGPDLYPVSVLAVGPIPTQTKGEP